VQPSFNGSSSNSSSPDGSSSYLDDLQYIERFRTIMLFQTFSIHVYIFFYLSMVIYCVQYAETSVTIS
jgi:hypothetical protein